MASHAYSNACIWQHMHIATHAYGNTCILQHMHMATHAYGNTCIWQHVHMATHAYGNTCIWQHMHMACAHVQWRSEGIWRPGANLHFAPPPPLKKFLKNDNKMSSIQLFMCIYIYIGVAYMYILRLLT